jgi:hypothetical protein
MQTKRTRFFMIGCGDFTSRDHEDNVSNVKFHSLPLVNNFKTPGDFPVASRRDLNVVTMDPQFIVQEQFKHDRFAVATKQCSAISARRRRKVSASPRASRSRDVDKAITNAAHGFQVLHANRTQLVTKPPHVGIHGARIDLLLVFPNITEQRIA